MKGNEKSEREAVIKEAKEWLGTPYHTEARLKGAGVDCGLFLLQVMENTGFIEHTEIPHYSVDIACNCAEPKYLNKIKEFCTHVDGEPLPGDIIVYKFPGSKVPHHAAFCVDKEYIIHSYTRQGVILSNRKGYRKYEIGIYRLNRWV